MATCTALTNVVGNTVATFYVARWEKAFDQAKWDACQAGEPDEELTAATPATGLAAAAPVSTATGNG
jgi:aerobic C4-dicarboxylate transport protein